MHLPSCPRNPASLIILAFLTLAALVFAQGRGEVKPFPASFHAEQMPVLGGTQYVRIGGQVSPAVVLLHGFGDTGDMWESLARVLVKNHQLIVPDCGGWACPPTRKQAMRKWLRHASWRDSG